MEVVKVNLVGDNAQELMHKVKAADKTKALELLGRHLGMFKDTVDMWILGSARSCWRGSTEDASASLKTSGPGRSHSRKTAMHASLKRVEERAEISKAHVLRELARIGFFGMPADQAISQARASASAFCEEKNSTGARRKSAGREHEHLASPLFVADDGDAVDRVAVGHVEAQVAQVRILLPALELGQHVLSPVGRFPRTTSMPTSAAASSRGSSCTGSSFPSGPKKSRRL